MHSPRSRSHFILHSEHSHFLSNEFLASDSRSIELQLYAVVKSNYFDFNKIETTLDNSFQYFQYLFCFYLDSH